MIYFGFATSPKARELIAHEWKNHRAQMILHIVQSLLDISFAAFIGVMAGLGVSLLAWSVLEGGAVFDVISRTRLFAIIAYSAAMLFLLSKLSRDHYYAAELGYKSVFDYELYSKPEVRLLKIREMVDSGKSPTGHE